MLAELSIRKISRWSVTCVPRQPGPQQGHHQQRDQQQLQEQQQVAAQPLPDRVDVQVLNRAAPQVRAGDLQRLTLEFQEVQQHDGERDGADQSPLPPGERVE